MQTEHSYVEFNTEQTPPDDSTTPSPVTETTEQSEHSPGIDELQAVSLTFVNDLDVPEVQVQDIQRQDEYEPDSDTEREYEVEFQVVSKTCMTRSGRAVHSAGGKVGLMVRALAFHRCVPGSISALGVTCGLSLLVLYSALRGFSPGSPVFPSHQKPTFGMI